MTSVWAMSVYVESAIIKAMLEKLPEDVELACGRLKLAAAQAIVLQKRHKVGVLCFFAKSISQSFI
jgi:hypothetical protein